MAKPKAIEWLEAQTGQTIDYVRGAVEQRGAASVGAALR